jgi:uncharacterized protein YndB with AHSA1/START domain
MTRVFHAPRELVFDAFTRREHLERWQGAPMGMTVTVELSDIRPGGAFRICMRAPDGAEHWLEGVYQEVVRPERLVYTHAWLDGDKRPRKETLVTMTFVQRGATTEITLRQTGLASPASRDGHEQGWSSTFDRLAGYLADQNNDAPRREEVGR